jgi:hypothetical protein
MSVCQRTMKLVDESHRADLVPLEAAAHLEVCPDCRRFADERAALRNLLGSGERVTAPASFEAQLNRRLAGIRHQPARAWLNPAAAFKLAAAAAFIVIAAVMVPRFFDTSHIEPPRTTDANVVQPASPPPPKVELGHDDPVRIAENVPSLPGSRSERRARGTQRIEPPTDIYLGRGEGGVVLFRGDGEDIEMPVRTVSLGAQPVLYGPETRQPARSMRSSF